MKRDQTRSCKARWACEERDLDASTFIERWFSSIMKQKQLINWDFQLQICTKSSTDNLNSKIYSHQLEEWYIREKQSKRCSWTAWSKRISLSINNAISSSVNRAIDEANAATDAVTDETSELIKWLHFRHLIWLLQLEQSIKLTRFSFAWWW